MTVSLAEICSVYGMAEICSVCDMAEFCSVCGMAKVSGVGQAGVDVCLLPSDDVKQCSTKLVYYLLLHLWCHLSFQQARNGSVNKRNRL